MEVFIRTLIALLVLVLWLAPAAIGLTDIACNFWTANQCSPVQWDGGGWGSAVIAWTMLLCVPAFAIVLTCAGNDL